MWHTQPLASWDTETSGINIETDRIVTSALVHYTPDSQPITRTWIADPGIDIPLEASNIHGYDTARARAEGRPAAEVVEEITAALTAVLEAGTPLVIMNAPFDATILDRECRRYGLATLEQRLGRPVGPVIDPLTIDRAADKYRKGRRTLEALAAHYGVELTDAHTADADALAAVEVAVAIARKYAELQVNAQQLHNWQIAWHARWAANFQEHLRRLTPNATVNAVWPLVPVADAAAS